MQQLVGYVRKLYASGHLTADKHGQKLFITFNQASLVPNNTRIDTKTITRILRFRIKEYVSSEAVELTEEQIEAYCVQFTSHSLKRSITTYAQQIGATDAEVTKQFRWTNDRTMREYVDTSSFKDSLTNKLRLA